MRVHLVMILMLCQVIFSERLVMTLATGGRGMVMVTDFLTPPLTLALVIIPFRRDLGRVFRTRRFLFFLPFLFLAFLLPLLGVAFNGFPARSAYSSWISIIPFCFICFGITGMAHAGDAGKVIRRYFLFAIFAQLGLALVQTLGEFDYLPGFLGAIHEWDKMFKFVHQPDNLILGRATGFYLNPNSLGIWALMALWTSFFMLEGRQRFFGVLGAVATVIFCQSRGTMAAMLLSGLIYGTAWIIFRANRAQRLKGTLIAVFCVLPVLVIALPGLSDSMLDSMHSLPYVGHALDRYVSGAKVLSQGAGADANFQERTSYWRTALDYLALNPFGSLGSPEMVIKRPSDNQFIAVLEQGSFYYLGALVAVFLGAFRLINRHEPHLRLLAVAGLSLAINSISAVPFSYVAAHPFWLMAGLYLGGHLRPAAPFEEDEP